MPFSPERDIAHSVVSRLWKSFFNTTGMCSRRHGEVVLEVRRLQMSDISSYQQKGTGAPQLSRTGHAYYSEMRVKFSLSSDCRRQLIWRESGTALSSRKYPGKGPISDMQYHGVTRHHDQWPHAPTCGWAA
ncbi:hypothetical protein TNCV_2403741 [Trichonephila clavipes]|uniref:Uncharacterized protein n=1 Tax=Trichonephila clavipes TaxID=2585209 RepID=A0A8X6R0G1_TRICX|nr:hypothetical protein TNCV_2403741 [Trichonephila clavipes]